MIDKIKESKTRSLWWTGGPRSSHTVSDLLAFLWFKLSNCKSEKS